MVYPNGSVQQPQEAGPSRPPRGRPAGAGRVALNEVQKRARNAAYERENRKMLAEALAILSDHVDCDRKTPMATVLAKTSLFIREMEDRPGLRDLQGCNQRLEAQIADIERQLAAKRPAVRHNRSDLRATPYTVPQRRPATTGPAVTPSGRPSSSNTSAGDASHVAHQSSSAARSLTDQEKEFLDSILCWQDEIQEGRAT